MVNKRNPGADWSEAISESRRVDWEAEASQTLDPSDARLLEQYQAIARIADGNRRASVTETEKITLPFRTWGHLRLAEPIGAGTYGEVFRAWDDTLRREVALKLFRVEGDHESSAAMANDLLEEARHLALVKHENVVRVFGAEVHQGRVGFWMEYIVGVSLAESLEDRGALDAAEASTIGIKLCQALSAVHAAGLLHRDIKSENVVREAGGRYYLMDFGAGAARLAGMSARPQIAGTPLYMAPEVFQSGETSVRSDLYSLGVLLFHMVTLRHPFEAKGYESLRQQISTGRPNSSLAELRPDLPEEFRRTVDQCLEFDPEKRFANAAELESALVDVISPRRSRSTATPNRWLNAVLLAALLVVLATQIPWRAWFSPTLADQIGSVAVLPIESLSAVGDEDYLVEGLSRALSTRLGRLEGLRVAAWKQSRELAESGLPPAEIASELGVDAVLQGSAVIENDRMVGHVELVRQSDGIQVWSTDFDESVEDVFSLQRDLVRNIASRIKGALSGEERLAIAKPAARSVDAYELYLKGANALDLNAQARADEADVLFERALQIDPNFVDAWVGRGVVAMNRWFFAWDGGNEALKLGRVYYQKALDLDPTNAYAVQGILGLEYEEGNMSELPSLAGHLSSGLRHDYERDTLLAEGFTMGGVPELAIAPLRSVIDSDPANVQAQWWYVISLTWARRYDEAIERGEAYFLRFGEDPEIHLWMGVAYLRQGFVQDALIHLQRARQIYVANPVTYYYFFLADVLRRDGRTDEARAVLEEGTRSAERILAKYPSQTRVRQDAVLMYSMAGDRLAARHHVQQLEDHLTGITRQVGEISQLLLGDPGDIQGFLSSYRGEPNAARWIYYGLHVPMIELTERYPDLESVFSQVESRHQERVAKVREEYSR